MKEYIFTTKNNKKCGYMRYDSADSEREKLYFYGDICGSTWESEYYTDNKAPQDVADFLNQLDSAKPLDIYVNSGGGDVFGGIAIYNILKRYQGEKIAHIDGIAASIAGIIPFACDKVIAPKSAQIMLHKPWSYCVGNSDDMKKCIESLEKCEQSIIDIYTNHAINGTTAQQIKKMIDRETWLTCEEASKYFAIELEDVQAVACDSDYFAKYMNVPENLAQKNNERKRKLQLELDMFTLMK